MKCKNKINHKTFKLLCASLAIWLLLSITACSSSSSTTPPACQHKWQAATCTSPKTCSLCNETIGSSLGHSWVDATCTSPKTCSTCGESTGTALGHNWISATCIAPKQCSICETTDGTYSIYDHEGVGSCSVCEIDYYQTLLNFVLTYGTKKISSTPTGAHYYWLYEKTVYFSGKAYSFKLEKSEDSTHIGCYLTKDSKYWFIMHISPESNGNYSYSFDNWNSLAEIKGKIIAANITSNTTELPYENYSSPGTLTNATETSQASAAYLQMLLKTLNSQFKSNSLPLSTKNFGFINYPGN